MLFQDTDQLSLIGYDRGYPTYDKKYCYTLNDIINYYRNKMMAFELGAMGCTVINGSSGTIRSRDLSGSDGIMPGLH